MPGVVFYVTSQVTFFLEPLPCPFSAHKIAHENVSFPHADLKKKKKWNRGFVPLKLKGKIKGIEKIIYFKVKPKY